MLVRVYVNLTRSSPGLVVYSVHKKVDGRWLVVDHTSLISLKNCAFKVSEKGRQRVLRQRRKNVHAFVVGTVANIGKGCLEAISYNPYRGSHFFIKKSRALTQNARYCLCNERGVFAIAPH